MFLIHKASQMKLEWKSSDEFPDAAVVTENSTWLVVFIGESRFCVMEKNWNILWKQNNSLHFRFDGAWYRVAVLMWEVTVVGWTLC